MNEADANEGDRSADGGVFITSMPGMTKWLVHESQLSNILYGLKSMMNLNLQENKDESSHNWDLVCNGTAHGRRGARRIPNPHTFSTLMHHQGPTWKTKAS